MFMDAGDVVGPDLQVRQIGLLLPIHRATAIRTNGSKEKEGWYRGYRQPARGQILS
jgi:hypothetical protein